MFTMMMTLKKSQNENNNCRNYKKSIFDNNNKDEN